jgi:hypothetical protein
MPRHKQKHEDVIHPGFVVIAMRYRKSYDIQRGSTHMAHTTLCLTEQPNPQIDGE